MKDIEKIVKNMLKKDNCMEIEKIEENKMYLKFYMQSKYYKTLEITKIKSNQWKVLIVPNNIQRITDLKGVVDLIMTFQKYSQAKEYTQRDIKQIKSKYKEGMKIELIKMYDYIKPVPAGTKGIVERVDALGSINMIWENDSRMPLIDGIDEFKILK